MHGAPMCHPKAGSRRRPELCRARSLAVRSLAVTGPLAALTSHLSRDRSAPPSDPRTRPAPPRSAGADPTSPASVGGVATGAASCSVLLPSKVGTPKRPPSSAEKGSGVVCHRVRPGLHRFFWVAWSFALRLDSAPSWNRDLHGPSQLPSPSGVRVNARCRGGGVPANTAEGKQPSETQASLTVREMTDEPEPRLISTARHEADAAPRSCHLSRLACQSRLRSGNRKRSKSPGQAGRTRLLTQRHETGAEGTGGWALCSRCI